MKTKEELTKDLLVEAKEDLIKAELREGFARYRHDETRENQYVFALAEYKKEIKELNNWISYLEMSLSEGAEAVVENPVKPTE